jgi:spore germination cell wall hydrolase CwlJ-like protein
MLYQQQHGVSPMTSGLTKIFYFLAGCVFTLEMTVLFSTSFEPIQASVDPTNKEEVIDRTEEILREKNLRKEAEAKEYECMVQNLWFEARGTQLKEMYAVAWVVKNRMTDGRFPTTICGVVKETKEKYCEFSWYCDGKSDQPVIRNKADQIAMSKIQKIAKEFSSGQIKVPDLTNGAVFFHNVRVNPSWASVYNQTIVIQHHKYYK